jgi:hypothetical protein
MKYKVVTYIGNYPLEHQPLWDRDFSHKREAIDSARIQHDIMLYKTREPWIYTVVQNELGDKIHWILYDGIENRNRVEATRLADKLGAEDEKG